MLFSVNYKVLFIKPDMFITIKEHNKKEFISLLVRGTHFPGFVAFPVK